MRFNVGDRVLCIEPHHGLVDGNTYVIERYSFEDEDPSDPDPIIYVEGIKNEGFYESRFEHAKTEQELAKEQQKINAVVSDAFFQSLDKCLQDGQSTPKNDAKG